MSQKKYTIILLSFLAFLVSLVIFLYRLDAKQKEQALFKKFDEQIELRNKEIQRIERENEKRKSLDSLNILLMKYNY